MAVDPRKRYVDRLKKTVSDSTSHVDQAIYLGILANNTPAEIFVLGDASNLKRFPIADGEAALLTLDSVIKKTSDGSVTAERSSYTVKRVGSTVTVAALSAGTVVVPSAGTAALVVTVTAPTNAAYTVTTRINKLSALA